MLHLQLSVCLAAFLSFLKSHLLGKLAHFPPWHQGLTLTMLHYGYKMIVLFVLTSLKSGCILQLMVSLGLSSPNEQDWA